MIEGNGIVLGIDLGTNSLGWALIDQPNSRFIATGVRVFDAGMDKMEQDGKGESRAIKRREARGIRRRLERSTERLVDLASALQKSGLLPAGDVSDSLARHELFNKLDKTIEDPYRLRARALDDKLSLHEIGRAIYHICQRRGFLSNRNADSKKKDDEKGKVKSAIGELADKMNATGARTLGEYFSKIDPHEERIRARYTSRAMYEREFNMIWEAQKAHYSDKLTDALYKDVHRAIFYQRPLKSQKGLIGQCELEPEKRRAPWALLISQRYRYLQKLNELRILSVDGESLPLNSEERAMLLEELERKSEIKFPAMRKLLKLPKMTKFNLEAGGEDSIKGNNTFARLRSIFGDRWDSMSEADREAVVEDVRSINKDEALMHRGMKRWGLDEEAARKFGEVELEQGYCSFSKKAIARLMPELENGIQVQTAIRELYPERWNRAVEPLSMLPPIKPRYDCTPIEMRNNNFSPLRNPVVERTLTELRTVVNAIIRKFGKPDTIRIELARDLKQTSKEREKTWKRNRENERQRKAAAEKILKEAGLGSPSRNDILKVQLAEECDWHCPYTGKPISMNSLLGQHPQFDIEHIIPFHRSLDDSYMNKTLCYADENRNRKHGKTPFEAYEGTPQWNEMLDRVKKFKVSSKNDNNEKLRRFKFDQKAVKQYIMEFSNRQLNDTRYATSRAKEYLGLLYGGINSDGIDATNKRRVQASGGQVTAFLRAAWGLNAILGDGGSKSRDDHRHHAVDAIVIALTDHAWQKKLSDAAQRAPKERRRLFAEVEAPWNGFLEQARASVLSVIPSRRISRRVRGALHNETFYGRPRKDEKGNEYVHIRKALDSLAPKDIEAIIDLAVRSCVQAKLIELGENDPKKAFKDKANHPRMKRGDRMVPIHKVRILDKVKTFAVGSNHKVRHVQSESNHHMVFYSDVNTGKWDAEVVSLYEAYIRKSQRKPVVTTHFGPDKQFKYSLSCGECIQIGEALHIVRTIPQSKQIRFVSVNDARRLADIDKKGQTGYPETLRKMNCQKVLITPLGEVRRASD